MPLPPSPSRQRGPLLRGVLFLVRIVLTVLIVLDELVRPLYRPLIDAIAALRLVARIEASIARQPRGVILVLFAVPFAIAEPLKLAGLILVARGQVVLGLVILGFAHLGSFLIVERIYHAGREKLLTYGWFAWGIGILDALRRRALGWIRSSSAYAAAMRARDGARRWWRSLRA